MTKEDTILLVCIGAQKAGTTWLSRQLQNHPTIYTPPIKEIHHFDSIYRKTIHRVRNKRIRMFKQHVAKMAYLKLTKDEYMERTKWLFNYCVAPNNDDEWYLSLFDFDKNIAKNKKVFIDNTPEYSILDKDALKHIKSMHPNVKIIFMMREPKSRTWSAIRYFSKNNPEKSLLDSEKKMINFIQGKGTEKRNDYLATIKRIEEVFPKSDILYEFYENIFISETTQLVFLQKICDFLNIDFNQSYFNETINDRVNATAPENIPKAVDDFLIKKYAKNNLEMKKQFKTQLPENWI